MPQSPSQLPRKPLTGLKRVSRRLKTAVRQILSPVVPWLPDRVTNVFPSLGRVSTWLPNGAQVRLISDGDDGKDYIARKVAGRSLAQYEAETMQVFLRLLEKSATFIDVGANTGLFALAAAVSDPRRQVFAFEPVPQIVQRIQANVRLNQLQNVSVESFALSDFVGELEFHVPATTASLPSSASAAAGFKLQTQAIRVPTITLDAFVEQRDVRSVDLMKIDTETTEHFVLSGGANLIRRDQPAILCEVLYREGEQPIQRVLNRVFRPLGYRFFWITDDGLVETQAPLGDPRVILHNYLFIPPRRLREVEHLVAPSSSRYAA